MYHYLVSLFNQRVLNVSVPTDAPRTTPCVGASVVRALPGVVDPVDVADLLNQKYTNMLAQHGLATHLAYDAMRDAANIDLANSSGITSGAQGTIGMHPTAVGMPTPVLQTTAYALSSSPSQATLVYELFEYLDSDPKDGRYARVYSEVDPDLDVRVEVSFNGGTSWTPFIADALTPIASLDRGSQMVVRFTRTTDCTTRGRVLVGSWAVLY